MYSDLQLEKAEMLINTANIYAISLFGKLINDYPELEVIVDSNLMEFWDFLITIACVGTAFREIADSALEEDQSGICYAIKDKLNEYKLDSYAALADMIEYVAKLTNSSVEIPDAIGAWIWVNFEKHDNANLQLIELSSSLKFVRIVGLPILTSFHDWWKN